MNWKISEKSAAELGFLCYAAPFSDGTGYAAQRPERLSAVKPAPFHPITPAGLILPADPCRAD
jgi:hypothetical protein